MATEENNNEGLIMRLGSAMFGVFSAFAMLMSLWGLTIPSLISTPALKSSTGAGFWIIFLMGFLVAVAQGLLWSVTERVFRWHFRAGDRGLLPQGWSALALSLTLSIPLVVLPPIWQAVQKLSIIPPQHWSGAVGCIIACGIAHLLLFGMDKRIFPGFCSYLRFLLSRNKLFAELLVLLIYSLAIVVLSIVAYWYFARPDVHMAQPFFLVRIALAFMAPFFGGSAFILLHYPDSVQQLGAIGLRGLVVAIALDIGLTVGIYFV